MYMTFCYYECVIIIIIFTVRIIIIINCFKSELTKNIAVFPSLSPSWPPVDLRDSFNITRPSAFAVFCQLFGFSLAPLKFATKSVSRSLARVASKSQWPQDSKPVSAASAHLLLPYIRYYLKKKVLKHLILSRAVCQEEIIEFCVVNCEARSEIRRGFH